MLGMLRFYSICPFSGVNCYWPVASTIPSNITIISNCCRRSCSGPRSHSGLLAPILCWMTWGSTRKRRSDPVSYPRSISVCSSGRNSPSAVWRDLINFARTFASTMWLSRRSPRRNIRHSWSSRFAMTHVRLKRSVSARFLGRDILTNMQPTMRASIMEPTMHCIMTSSTPSWQVGETVREP